MNDKLYQFLHGHPFLLKEEADIICEVRFNPYFKWMNDSQIKAVINNKTKRMYETKFPDAKSKKLEHVFDFKNWFIQINLRNFGLGFALFKSGITIIILFVYIAIHHKYK